MFVIFARVLFIYTRKVFQVKLAAGTCGAMRKKLKITLDKLTSVSFFVVCSFLFFLLFPWVRV
jgi:hypothetical protein